MKLCNQISSYNIGIVLFSRQLKQMSRTVLNAAKTPRVQPKIEPEKESAASSFINDSSLTEDSFDSSFVMKSLRQRMNELDTDFDRWLGRKEESGDQGEAKAKADATGRSKPLKGLLSSASQSSDDDDDDESELLKRHKPKTVVRRKKNAPVQVARPSKADDSDLEDVFGGLSIETAPKVARPKPPLGAPTAAGTRPTHRSFLASLSADLGDEQRHPEATFYVGKSFRKRRDELTSRLFGLFNAGVFDGALPADLSVTWNARLTRTAGYCRHWSRRDAADAGAVRFESRIELSVKVVDTPCRLRDTLIHESVFLSDTIEFGYIIHGIYHPAAYIGHFRPEPKLSITKPPDTSSSPPVISATLRGARGIICALRAAQIALIAGVAACETLSLAATATPVCKHK